MDVARRFRVGLVALGALLVSAVAAVPALASPPPDPFEGNAPYLAWRGEQVRLVKCHPAISPTGLNQRADLILIDWSGEEHALAIPHLEMSTAGFFAPTGPDRTPPVAAAQGCVGGTWISQKAGIAQIKLVVSAVPAGTGVVGSSITGPSGTPILKHDFFVGWMNLNPPVLSAANAGVTGPGPQAGGAPITTNPADLIDVAGQAAGNNFRVDVTGNIPLRANFRELGLGDTLTMPTDWPRLANVLATGFDPNNPNPAFTYWDIHDDQLPTEGHGGESVCRPATGATAIDAVDNCPQLGAGGTIPIAGAPALGAELGAFSRFYLGATNPTIGPFDPAVPGQTLLSDGKVDAGDAPMPAARIDFTTTGGGFFGMAGSAGAIPAGFVAPAAGTTVADVTRAAKDKHVIYSRTRAGEQTAPAPNQHNLYAPFYGRFIPATARAYTAGAAGPGVTIVDPRLPANAVRVAEASGEDGPAGSILNPTNAPVGGTNNFAGWLVNGFYHYWDVARVIGNQLGGNTTCLLRNTVDFVPVPGGSPVAGPFTVVRTPIFRQFAAGPSTVAIYTDEHGEGHVFWYPGTGFNFGALGIAGNLNLGCELQNVNPLARPTIQAIARYPYEPVTAPPVTSNVITKTVLSQFNKILRCVPKGTNPNDQFSQICLAEARDITGSPAPFVGEIVCFASNAEMIQHFTGATGPVLGGGGVTVASTVTIGGVTVPTLLNPAQQAALGKQGAAVLCVRLDAAGRAAVEVFGKGPSNVIADFVEEGLIRVVTFSFASGTGATGTGEVSSDQPPTPQQIAAVNNAPAPVVKDSNGQTVPGTSGNKPEITQPKGPAPALHRIDRAPELIRPVRGKPYLLVKVSGPAGKVKIRIRMIGAKGTLSTVERAIDANKLVKVTGLKISSAVRTIRVSVVN